MKQLSLCMLVALALLVSSAAIAQAGGSPRSPQSSPGMSQQQGSPSQQPGYPSSQQPGAGSQTGGQDQSAQAPSKSEKKLKGCVQQEGGQYVLQTTKKGNIALTGQDVSAHNGHEVAVKGTWESGGSSAASSSGSSGKTFNVSSVDMISENCSMKKGSSGSMGTSPSGTGQSTGSQPPQ